METKALLSLKADSDGVVSGYASKFSEIDRGGDQIAPGAYAKCLAGMGGRKVKMLWQHDPSAPIGVWDQVKEDETGLHVRGRILPEVEKGREAKALVEAGAIDGLSIGYQVHDAEKKNGVRVLKEIELWEVSLVTFPMQETARIDAVKAAIEFEQGGSAALLKRLIEGDLREAGFSINEAKAAASAAAAKLGAMREAGAGLDELRAALVARVNL